MGSPDTLLIRFDDEPSDPFPEWARWLVELGAIISKQPLDFRVIVVVATPVATPTLAGLTALGSTSRRLFGEDTDDQSFHLERLKTAARRPGQRFRSTTRRGIFTAMSTSEQVYFINNREQKHYLLPVNAKNWHLDGEPAFAVRPGHGGGLEHGSIYAALSERNSPPDYRNLNRSDSFTALALHPRLGRAGTGEVLRSVQLQSEEKAASLRDLLAVHSWLPRSVSRTRLVSSRRRENPLDRGDAPPGLIVADGCRAFAFSEASFGGESLPPHIISIIPRIEDRELLETTDTKLNQLTQWFSETDPRDLGIERVPKSMGILLLREER